MKRVIKVVLALVIFVISGCDTKTDYESILDKLSDYGMKGTTRFVNDVETYNNGVGKLGDRHLSMVYSKEGTLIRVYYTDYNSDNEWGYCVYGDCYQSETEEKKKEIKELGKKDGEHYKSWLEDLGISEEEMIEFFKEAYIRIEKDVYEEGKEISDDFWKSNN